MATPSLPQDEAPDPFHPSPSLHQPPSEIATATDNFRRRVGYLVFKADQLEHKVNEVSKFYSGEAKKGTCSVSREKLLCRSGSNNNDSGLGCSGSGRKEVVECSKKMQDVMRQFGNILRQSEMTLWRLKLFVKGALELQAKNSASKADDILKRKVIYDALKIARKRSTKPAL